MSWPTIQNFIWHAPNISKFLTSETPPYCAETLFLPLYLTAVQIQVCNEGWDYTTQQTFMHVLSNQKV